MTPAGKAYPTAASRLRWAVLRGVLFFQNSFPSESAKFKPCAGQELRPVSGFFHFAGGTLELFLIAAEDLEDQDPNGRPYLAGGLGAPPHPPTANVFYSLRSRSHRLRLSVIDPGGAGISFRTPAGNPSAFSVASREAESLTNIVAAGVGDR